MKNGLNAWTIKVFKQDTYIDGVHEIGRCELRLRAIASEFARCFQLEHHHDFPPFDETVDADGVSVYLFGSGAWLGACGFSPIMDRAPGVPAAAWMLDWVWLHPFFRRRGLLAKAWPLFEAKYGKFLILAPLSPAMQAFVDAREVAKDRIVVLDSEPNEGQT